MLIGGDCAQCGGHFERKQWAREYGKFCSRACSSAWQQAHAVGKWEHWWFRDCAVCGIRYLSRRAAGGGAVCSKECELERERRRASALYVPAPAKPCGRCGVAIQGRVMFCDTCRPLIRAEKKRRDRRRQKRGNENHRARARARGCVYAPVSRQALLDTHGKRCWICRRAIRFDVDANHPMAFSVDHVVPLSMGGWHDLINLRLAHRQCNAERSDNYSGQLMLCYQQDGVGAS